jgi:hypothetical protein
VKACSTADIIQDVFLTDGHEGLRTSHRSAAFDEMYLEFRTVVTLIDTTPALSFLSPTLGWKETSIPRITRKEALDKLSDAEIVNQFGWRLETLACHLYSLNPRIH